MDDFQTKIKSYTWLPEETRDTLLKLADQLSDKLKVKMLDLLAKTDAEIQVASDEKDSKLIEIMKQQIEDLKEIKRGPMREAMKNYEKADRGADEQAAEDLLKDL